MREGKRIQLLVWLAILLTFALPTSAQVGEWFLYVGQSTGDTTTWQYVDDGASPSWRRTSAWDLPNVGGSQYAGPAFGDLDHDGDKDAVVGRAQGNCWGYKNVGSAGEPVWVRNEEWDCPLDVGYSASPDLFDLDHDGDLDLLLGDSSGRVLVLENRGDASNVEWIRKQAWEISQEGQYAIPRICHLDADGYPDLLVGARYSPVRAYRNMGSLTAPDWQRMNGWDLPAVGGERIAIEAVDADGDGDCDLFLGQRSGPVIAYRNTGDLAAGPIWTRETAWDLGEDAGRYTAPAVLHVNSESTDPGPIMPAADAGPDQMLVDQDMDGFESVTLNGSGSSGPAGALESYSWREGDVELGTMEIVSVDLSVGVHVISLTVADNQGNTASDTVTVSIEPPSVSEPARGIDLQRARMVFHYHNVPNLDTYGPADYLYITAYLKKEPEEVFPMPFDKQVTIAVAIPDPIDPSKLRTVFAQTIPDDAVEGSGSRYRYTSGPPGIRELELSEYSSSLIYFYLGLDKVMFLPEFKNASCYEGFGCPLTALEYRDNYVLPISSITVTVDIGGGDVWKGEGPLKPDNYNEHYQYLVLSP